MLKKIGILLLFSFVLLIIAGFTIPYFFKDEIKKIVLQEINKKTQAKIHIGSVDLSLLQNFKNFPDIAIVMQDIQITSHDTMLKDTLAQIQTAKLSLDLMSILKKEKQYKIHDISVLDGKIHAIVYPDSTNNWTIMTQDSSSDKSTQPFSLHLKGILLEKIQIKYDDYITQKHLNIADFYHKGSGDFDEVSLIYKSKTKLHHIDYSQNVIKMLSKADFIFDGECKINQSEQRYTFEKSFFTLNTLTVNFDGFIAMAKPKEADIHLKFNTLNNEFKNVLSLIPTIYTSNFKDIKASGKFALNGEVQGIYTENSYPKFNLNLAIDQGEFQYPSLPKKVSQINLNSKIYHPGGHLDAMIIEVPQFSFLLGNFPWKGKLKLWQTQTNPSIDLQAKGAINLAEIKDFYPIEDTKNLQGNLDLDLSIQANQAAIQQKNYAAVQAAGYLKLNQFIYEPKSSNKTIFVEAVSLNFSPQYVDMTQCKGKISKSDFDMTGKLENFIGYFLGKDETMNGKIQFNANYIDANEFISESTNKSQREDYIQVPKNIDFNGNANIGQMDYGNLKIKNLFGGMSLQNQKITLQQITAEMLGGKATINGYYRNTPKGIPESKIAYDVENFDIQQMYQYMNTAKQLAPIIEYMNGKFSTNSDLSFELLPDMSPDLNTLNGKMNIKLSGSSITNMPILNQIAQLTKLNLNPLNISDVSTNLDFVQGNLILNPTKFPVSGYTMNISGKQGLNKQMDYKIGIDVPFDKLGNATNVVNGMLSKVNLPFLNNLKPSMVRLNILVSGLVTQPKISLGAPDIVKGDGNAVLQSSIEEPAKELLQNAKQEATKQVDSLKSQVKQEVDKKVEEVKTQVNQEVEKKKNELLDGLKKKLPW
ncbi:MAG: AsmA family protein [Chitinophagales bacterium]|nr:AsmA family protein [Chitinophagales bacterium]